MPFNPNRPCRLGLEWVPATEPSETIGGAPPRRGRDLNDGYPPVGATVLTSAVTETIDKAHVFLSFADAPGSGFEVEVYDADDLPAAATTTTSFLPTADAVSIDSYGYDNGTQVLPGAGTLFGLIDNTTPTAGTYGTYGRKLYDNTFLYPIFGAGMEYAANFGSVVGTLTGQAVTKVELRAKVAELVDTRLVTAATFTPYININGARFFGPAQTVAGAGRAGFVDIVAAWTANPATGCSWRIADVEQFDDATAGSSAGWVVSATGSANNLPVIFSASLDVTTVATEKRVAVGCITVEDGALPGWYSATLAHPDGTDNWSKVSGTDYLIVLRRRTGDGTVKWRYLSSGVVRAGTDPAAVQPSTLNGPPSYSKADVTMVAGTGFPLSVRSTSTRQAFAVILETTAPATSTDSQPYASIGDDIAPSKGVVDYWSRVDTATVLEQEVTTDGTGGTYGTVVFMAAVADADTPPADSLYVRILNGAGVQQGDTLEVELTELTHPRDLFRTLVRRLPGTAPALSAATQYRIEFSSPGSTAGQGWRVQVCSTGNPAGVLGPPSDSALATFGGSTDTARVNGVGYDYLDVATYLMTVPAHTFNLAATQVTIGADTCSTGAQLSWDASTVAGCDGFLRYEIQRRDTVDFVWRDVAAITTESVEQWTDVECRRGGIRTEWRMRVVRGDGSPSDWTDNVALNVTSPCGGFTLATNQDTAKTVHYADVGNGRRQWEFPDGDKTIRHMMASNFAVAYGGLEYRGDTFELDLLVIGQGVAPGLGVAVESGAGANVGITAFDALRVLATQKPEASTGQKFTPSYIAVCDDAGGRWFASIAVTSAVRRSAEGEAHEATVGVVEVTNVPAVVDVA